MPRPLEVTVQPTCISSGYCRNTAPAVFGALPNRQSFVLSNPVPESAELSDAVESCPVEAIVALDSASGERMYQ